MNQVLTGKRIRKRLGLELPVRVRCRETLDFEWVETTRLIGVTPFGTGFTLKRPTEKGRLLHLTIPMPRQLRMFDYAEDQYRIWALVRYLRTLEPSGRNLQSFEVGVAFIGKYPPRSYEADPSRRYEISRATTESLHLAEETEKAVAPLATSGERSNTRHHIPVDMLIEIVDEKGEVTISEHTVTEDISRNGAKVFTALTIPVGRVIRLTSQQYKMTVHAAVRARTTGVDGIPRIHLEFVDKEWRL